MRAPGFLVWSPQGGIPRIVHQDPEAALEEASRLTRCYPSRQFFVMAPLLGGPEVNTALAWSKGVKAGLAQGHAEVVAAEARADVVCDERDSLKRRLAAARPIIEDVRRFRSAVADCLCWFAGFSAGSSSDYSAPWTPSRDTLSTLNRHLQDVERVVEEGLCFADEEIPF